VQLTHIAPAPAQASAPTSSAVNAPAQRRSTSILPRSLLLELDLPSTSGSGSASTDSGDEAADDTTPVLDASLRRSLRSLRDSYLSTNTLSNGSLFERRDRRSLASFASGATIGTALDSPSASGSGANTTETLSAFALGRPRRARIRRDAQDEGMLLGSGVAGSGEVATGRLWGMPRLNQGDYIVGDPPITAAFLLTEFGSIG